MKKFVFILITVLFAVTCHGQVRTLKEAKEDMKNGLIEMCKSINQQAPIKVDEYLSLNSIMFINWQLILNYYATFSSCGLKTEDFDGLREMAKEELKKNVHILFINGNWKFSIEQFRTMMKDCELKFLFGFFDCDGKLMFNIRMDYRK